MTRICIYTKDIQRITGRSERHCRNIINDIKTFYKKEKHQVVTIDEFCQYMGIAKENIAIYMK